MKLTSYQLKRKDAKFWGQLIILLSTSPYFGKLGWKFNPTLKDTAGRRILPEPEIFNNIIPNNGSEEEICRTLIRFI